MEPLKALVRLQNVVSTCSKCLSTLTEEYEHQGRVPLESGAKPSDDGINLHDDAELNTHRTSTEQKADTPEDQLSRVFFRTKYDIYVELNADATRVLEISLKPPEARMAATSQATIDSSSTRLVDTSYKSNALTPPLASPDIESMFRYEIQPDWQTSYLWHDPNWPGTPEESSVVDSEDIEHRYPRLYPYWDRWVDFCETEYYDKVFGGFSPTHDHETFVLIDRQHTVAWEVNGFLLACWLLQQPDVDSVVYMPHNIVYDLNAENKEAEFEKLLKHVAA